jgi:hypothetical protein
MSLEEFSQGVKKFDRVLFKVFTVIFGGAAISWAVAIIIADSPLLIKALFSVLALLGLFNTGSVFLSLFKSLSNMHLFYLKCTCIAMPALWLIGSLDKGRLSSQELFSVLFPAILYWFHWLAARPNFVKVKTPNKL